MKIKRTFAPDITQAIRKVREEQGAEAVILGNRKVDGGVEIISAVDYDERVVQQALAEPEPANDTPTAPSSFQQAAKMAMEQVRPFRPEHINTVAGTAPGAYHQAAEEGEVPDASDHLADNPIKTATPGLPAAQPAAPIEPLTSSSTRRYTSDPAASASALRDLLQGHQPQGDQSQGDHFQGDQLQPDGTHFAQESMLVDMQRELKALRGLLENQLSVLEWRRLSRRHPTRIALLRQLDGLGLGADLTQKLVDEVSDGEDLERAWRTALANLANRIPISDDDFMSHGGVVAVVGATGVGKTTTVAKLAARFAMQQGPRNVALVTTDSFRIGAHEQLQSFARILGVPLHMAREKDELSQVLSGLFDKKLVLIDTAGMSQRDLRLSEQFATLQESSPLIRCYLTLSANTQLAALDEVIRAFGKVDLVGCVITKLDEAASLGGTLTATIRHRLPIAYVGVGQRVPEDLQPARAHRLVSQAVPFMDKQVHNKDKDALAVKFSGL
jgi:flagellar biosynthesis protein FlhF